jgi:hypothetical protein
MSVEDWQRTISENKRRKQLQQRIQNGEGEQYVIQYAAGTIQTAARQLSDFMGSAEVAFIRQELAKRPYDQAALSRSYSSSVSNAEIGRAWDGRIKWPAEVFVLAAGDFTGPQSTAREYHAMTAAGLTQFRHSYSLWSGPFLKARPITPEAVAHFKALNVLGSNPHADGSTWRSFFHEYDPQYSWEDWTQIVRLEVDSRLYSAPSTITSCFSQLVSRLT